MPDREGAVPTDVPDFDVVIVGAGAAGLSLAHHLCAPGGRTPLSIALVGAPPGPLSPPRRTWCFWERGAGPYDGSLTASWSRLRVRTADGSAVTARLPELRYKMLRSDDFETLVGRRLAASRGLRRTTATVGSVRDLPGGGAEVLGRDAAGERVRLRGRHVFDSRPPRLLPPARTTLLQHFSGWFVRTERPVFDPAVPDLMDFRTPRPARGLSFGYVLPMDARTALVEYTEFSPAPLDADAYRQALDHYTREVLRLGPFEVTAREHGAIPMTDGRFPRRAGRSVYRIGTAGGATRPSTGYTFAAVQRQSRAIAAALRAGRPLRVPAAHSRRSRAMDAVMLRALDTGRIDGSDFFGRLFRGVPAERLLTFLDGGSRWYEDLLIGVRTPVAPMLRTVAELPFTPRRPSLPLPPPPSGPEESSS
ncbi:lycopene cyclase family protein [Streptomyces sp. NPDC087897]|uniref:lycopene cyclase family protein n=1 Tax=Streptomyces sp. NPDC087897 TaxID=3365817 RepID=UPI00380A25CC